MQVVGGEQRQVEGPRYAKEVVAVPALDVEAVIHEFAEEVAGAEDVAEVGGSLQRPVVIVGLQPPVDLAAGAPRGGNQPRPVGLQQLSVKPRLVVVTLKAGEAGEPEEVVHARRGLGEQGHVRVVLPALAGRGVVAGIAGITGTAASKVKGLALKPTLRGVVPFHADDGLDARGGGLLPELEGAVEVAVVGDRDGRHLLAGRLGDQISEPGCAIEHGVLGVHVQVHELVAHTPSPAHPSRNRRGKHRTGV
ncbi:unannotated protein [freshwater metagenome]|uniref:Unannotated protein n=1 Tax=freshwater metagenome TaxID=449393 RepID=A0A6J7QSN0_9ZZZZ